jgi:hypothetical protein
MALSTPRADLEGEEEEDEVQYSPSHCLMKVTNNLQEEEETDDLTETGYRVVNGSISDLDVQERMIYEHAKDAVRDETLFYCPFPDAARTIDICSNEWMHAQSVPADQKVPLSPLGLYLVLSVLLTTCTVLLLT